jgi:glycosyltransferase involved in cell wall biosynthesis
VVEAKPNWSFLLIGPIKKDLKNKLDCGFKNVFYLGVKPYDDLPAYLKALDCAIVPFRPIELINATNPIKIYEYLASGLPVVSTKFFEVSTFGDLVYLANSEEEFVEALETAIKKRWLREEIERRQNFAQRNSWSKRVEIILNLFQVARSKNGTPCCSL